jgi:putative acetyltransferase
MAPATVVIRDATARDQEAVIDVVRRAFGRDDEADLLARLTDDGDAVGSLVADVGGAVVGHAMLSRLHTEIDGRPVLALALAPVSVRPTHQRRGIGSRLVEAAIDTARSKDAETVIVVGDPAFYGRFGFSAGRAAVLTCRYAGDAFQAIELVPGALSGSFGTVEYPPAFDAAE